MTAAELYEIVKDVPREAWPYLDWHYGEFVKKNGNDAIDDELAEQAFIGSMTAWLAGDLRIKQRQHNDGEMVYGVKANDGCYSVGGTHRTLVAALAAACKEAA